jgi:hypothetical protein
MLFDAISDRLLPSLRLWGYAPNRTVTVPQSFTRAQMYMSDSLEEKSKMLDISGELKLSILSGLIEVSGSAKYLNKGQSSRQQQTLSFVVTQTTEFEEYVLPTERETISSSALRDASKATHLVTSVTYGGTAVFEFEFERDANSSETQIEGRLRGVLNGLSSVLSGEGTIEGTTNDKELRDVSRMRCNFFGDFSVKRVPTTLAEAVEVLKNVSTLIRESRTPVVATLMPLAHFTDVPGVRIAQRISNDLVEEAADYFDTLSTTIVDAKSLMQQCEAERFSEHVKELKSFITAMSGHKSTVGQKIAEEMPKIRGGSSSGSELAMYLNAAKTCFQRSRLSEWVDNREKEFSSMKDWLERLSLSGATIALDQRTLNKHLFQQTRCALVISLPNNAGGVKDRTQASQCLTVNASGIASLPSCCIGVD